MKEKETRVARRHFLAGAGVVAAAAGAAALTARTPAAPPVRSPRRNPLLPTATVTVSLNTYGSITGRRWYKPRDLPVRRDASHPGAAASRDIAFTRFVPFPR